ncbi:hypothetical protein [Actinoplanes siamensis]|uniref:Uncharacterized protein n=1 Tax=Actinoplanes siamensis TaxID=1223317 RepID=A0A919N636_9ACTN|nr:hypothetical protein [Actinoplanes siamensis]GIF05060.1 hypothetical protein Asi03nite_25980 [Actinoplanes siamensis]
MRTVKQLMSVSNPVPNGEDVRDSRAEQRLAQIVGAAGPRPRPTGRGRRRLVLVGAAAVLLVAGAGVAGVRLLSEPAVSPTADEPFFATTAELEDRAEAIVRATMTSARGYDADGAAETAATMRVTAVAKGTPVAGTPLEVVYTAGVPETPAGLHTGGEYVLLLQRRDASHWNLINTTQGYYTVADGGITAASDNPVSLSPATLDDLGLQ